MPINKSEFRGSDWVEIPLPNHPRDDYADILNVHEGPLPDIYIYEVEGPYDDMEDAEVETRQVLGKIKAEAQIDFPGEYAVVRLDADSYAETPPDELQELAEELLLAWATQYRRDHPEASAPPDFE